MMNKRNVSAELSLSAAQSTKERNYWIKKLSGHLVKNSFPYDHKGAITKMNEGKHELSFKIPQPLFLRLMKVISGSDTRFHMILVTSVLVLLDKYTRDGKGDIIVAAPIYNQEVKGKFVNTVLALRNRLEEGMTFKQLLFQVRQTITEAVENQNYPLETLLYHLDIPYEEGDDFPLFDTAVLLENIHDKSFLQHVKLNMIFSFCRSADHLEGKVEYNACRYERATIQRIVSYLIRLMQHALFNIDIPLEGIEILSEEEKHRLLKEFNNSAARYARHKTIVQLFEEQAEKHPDRTAVTAPGPVRSVRSANIYLTYDLLNKKSNQLARLLRKKGVKPGTIVGLLMGRTADMMVAIWGVIKAGGAYLPIAPETPMKRIVQVLEDAHGSILLTQTSIISQYKHAFTRLQNLHITRIAPYLTAPRPPIADLDTLPMPDRSLIDYDRYAQNISLAMVKHCISLQGTRGCPYSCAYCARLWPKKQVVRSAENLFAEVKYYYDLGVRRFSLIDDIFNLDIRNSGRFFQLITGNRLKLQLLFPAGLRGDIMTADYIDLMVEAGTINISVALETASPRLQKLIRKNLDIEKLRQNLDYICDKHPHVILDLFTMHGLPTETEEEATMTLDFVKSLQWLHFPLINITRIYPNTLMERLALDIGITRESILKAESLAWHEAADTLPFEKKFTIRYQADFLDNYFLKKERLLHVLPFQMKALTEDEIVQKYTSYLPTERDSPTNIDNLDKLLEFFSISRQDLGNTNCVPEQRFAVPGLGRKIREHSPPFQPDNNALRVLLLDLSQFYTGERQLLDELFEPPLGLMYLMTWLNKQLGSGVNGKIAKSGIDFDSDVQLNKLLDSFKPQVIGIRTLTYYKDFFHRTVSKIRQWGYTVPIIAGGPYATNGYTALLQDPNVDLVVMAEGEITFAEVIDAIKKNHGQLPSEETLKKIPGIVFIPGKYQGQTTLSWDILMMEELQEPLSREPAEIPGYLVRPTDSVYTIFTSGSTGIPKGVLIRHQNLHNLVIGLKERIYKKYPHSLRVALVSPYIFDASVKQIFGCLLLGHTLYIVPEETRADGFGLLEFFKNHKIEVTDGTPTHIKLLLESSIENMADLCLKHLLIGGEQLNKTTVEEFFRRFEESPPLVTNVYGPTECSVDATSYEICAANTRHLEEIPIGKPMPNHRVYILDAQNKNRLQPIGAAGELCIGGHGLAPGYLNRVQLTKDQFIPDPFEPGQIIYTTGDLALWHPDGNIRYLGRIDHQVKIRGYRLELGEIENQLLKHEYIKDAVVLARGEETSDRGDRYLCAYIVPGALWVFDRTSPVSESLRKYLSHSLPDYMLPAYFVQLDKIPLTTNGKVDRKGLPEPETSSWPDYTAPQNHYQEKLAEIWSGILKIKKEKISIDANFFEIGGHSLKATILISKIHKTFDTRIPLQVIFKTPTIKGVAGYIKDNAPKDRFTAIQPAPKREYYQLSSAQNRLFFLQQMDPGSVSYNLLVPVILEGPLDVERLENTFDRLIQRHESLRTAFQVAANEPQQKIEAHVEFEIEHYNMDESEVLGFIRQEFTRAFDLALAPLLRVGLIKVGPQRYIMVVSLHHIISDGTSQGILIREFMNLYEGDLLLPLRLQYKDYSEWQNSKEQKEFVNKQEEYWLKQFEGEIPKLNLPTDFQRPGVQSFEGIRVRYRITSDETQKIKKLATLQDVTLYMVLLAVFNIFLSKVTGQEDILVGTPVANRRHTDLESIIGMFVNMLVIRNFPTANKTFESFLKDVKKVTLQAFENQDYKFEDLVRQVVREFDQSRNPLFDVSIVVQNMEIPEIEISNLRLLPFNYYGEVSRFDLGFIFQENGEEIDLLVEYGTKLFKEETIKRFIKYFVKTVSLLVENPQITLSKIEIISEEEKNQILFDFNDTKAEYPGNKTIHQLFEEQVEKTPDHIAVVVAHELHEKRTRGLGPLSILMSITYNELNTKSLQLAHLLLERGVQPDTIVGLMVERSIEMIVGIMGILKAGGAYLPIDPGYPGKRINYMLADSGARILLSAGHHPDLPSSSLPYFSHLPIFPSSQLPFFPHLHLPPAPGTSLAYIIYTSGSSGRPKGVMVEHRSLVNRLKWMQKKYLLHPGDTILHKTPFTFDVSVWEIFWWAIEGARVCLLHAGGEKDPQQIIDTIRRNRITVMHFVPSMLSAFLEYIKESKVNIKMLASLKQVIASGETLTVLQVKNFNRLLCKENGTALANLYGPTEATIDVSFFDCPGEEDIKRVPIGKPIDNIKLFVTSKEKRLQPVGVAGELCISGDGLARGYLNNLELTAEKFDHDLWDYLDEQDKIKKMPGKRINRWYYRSYRSNNAYITYKTGDLVRWLPDGNIEFLGRLDHQVKIRGYRIELEEIENQLLKYNKIKEVIVADREDKRGNKYLCAYIVVGRRASASPHLLGGALREYLSQTLPYYMIPSYFVNLDEIPLNPNGKVDLKALPNPEEMTFKNNVEYRAPGNAIEKKLAEIWGEVLGRKNIGTNENFFMIGGDSIKAMRIISSVNKAGYKIEMRELFQYPTIERLSPKVKKLEQIPDQSEIIGQIPLTPIQEKFFTIFKMSPHHFNQAVMLYSTEWVDEGIIKAMFEKIQGHHDALRMTYRKNKKGEILQINQGCDYPLSLQVYDFRNRENSVKALEAKAIQIQASIDLEKGPLMKLGLFHLDDGDRLLIVIHHLVIDGVSWRILFEDIETLYQQYKQGKQMVLPLKTDSFKIWSEQISLYANSETFLQEKTYWKQLESVSVPKIENDFGEENNDIKDTRSLSFTLGEGETTQLLTETNEAFGTGVNDILLTAFGLGVKKTFGCKQLLIALEGHGREQILKDVDISRTIGWFTSLYPVLLEISYENDIGRQIKEIKESIRKMPNKGIGYGMIRYLTSEKYKEEIDFTLNPQVIFNYMGQFDADVGLKSFKMAKESPGNRQDIRDRREYELEVSGMTASNQLVITISYSKKQFKLETIEVLLNHFKSQLRYIIAFCSSKQEREFTPSDFTYKGLSIDKLDGLRLQYQNQIEDLYTLTPMQEGMLFHALYDKSSSTYFEQLSYRLHGELDKIAVKKSLNELCKRHDILRTAFVYENLERPIQVVLRDRQIDFSCEEICKIAELEDKERFIKEFKEKDKQHSFDLSKDILMRVSILQVDKSEHEFTWSFHHILMDGWCIGILNSEFLEIYNGYLENRPFMLPGVQPYRTYIRWLEKQDKKISKKFWKEYLASYEEATGFPGIKANQRGERYINKHFSFTLGREKTIRLKKAAARNHATLNVLFQSVWGIILSKYNGKEDMVFGTVVSGRPGELTGVESMVGLFINTIPVRIRYKEKTTFKELVQNLQESALESVPHHHYPLAEIQSETALKRSLIDHILVFENYPIVERLERIMAENVIDNHASKFEIKDIEIFEQTNYDFNLLVTPGKQIRLKFCYNANVFNSVFIKRIAHHLDHIIEQVLENEDIYIYRLTLLSEAEKNLLLYQFNDTSAQYSKDKVIHELFEDQAAKTPDNIALISMEPGVRKRNLGTRPARPIVYVAYKELNQKTNQLAIKLIEKGVGPDTIAAIMVDRSPEMIIGVLGILKAGGTYLPIDPDYPEERINYMLADSGAKVLVTTSILFEDRKLGNREGEKVFITTDDTENTEGMASPTYYYHLHLSPVPITSLAYIIYTSGSAGKPKGVMVEHRSVVNVLFALHDEYPFRKSDTYLLKTSFVFDVSITELFGWFLGGGSSAILEKNGEKEPKKILDIIEYVGITHINFVPSLFNVFAAELDLRNIKKLSALKYIFLAGEALFPELVNKFRQLKIPILLENIYGPTEGTVYVSKYSLSRWNCGGSIPIGKPLQNVRLYILDKNNHLQPIGVPGELCISGDGVARGYLNNPELTAQKFCLRQPGGTLFEKTAPPGPPRKNFLLYPSPHSLIYLTGDLAQWLSDGNIEFLGRIDSQVKIRGFRIELGEIESQLLNHVDIKEAVVISTEVNRGDNYLCAYIVSDKEFTVSDLREFLSMKLPHYMIPSYFISLEKIPLTPNGKVDRKALIRFEGRRLGLKASYEAPSTDTEKTISKIWQEILKIDKVGLFDNFFDLGGNSIKIIQLNSRLKEVFKKDISVMMLFEYPTIASISEYLSSEEIVRDFSNLEIDRGEVINRAKKSKIKQANKRKMANLELIKEEEL